MAEAFIGKFSETVEKESKQVEENAAGAVGNAAESVEGVADERKEEVEKKVADAKKSIASRVSHGLSKAQGLVHSAKDFADQKGTFASFGGSGEKKSEEADPLPNSDKDGGGS